MKRVFSIMVHCLDHAIYKLEKEHGQKMCSLSKAIFLVYVIIFLPS